MYSQITEILQKLLLKKGDGSSISCRTIITDTLKIEMRREENLQQKQNEHVAFTSGK